MTIAQKLEMMEKANSELIEAQTLEDGKSLNSSIFSQKITIENKRLSQETIKEILDWFIQNGAKFVSEFRIEAPMFERKNTKKRERTTWYRLEKGNMIFNLSHVSESMNFNRSVWEEVGRWLCNENEALGYYNKGMLEYVKKSGLPLIDLGEKKK